MARKLIVLLIIAIVTAVTIPTAGGAAATRKSAKTTGYARLVIASGDQTPERDSVAVVNSLGQASRFAYMLPPPDRGNGVPKIDCNIPDYVFADRNGILHIRYNCRYDVVNWGFRLTPKLQAIATGPVYESGARWWRNGVEMPRTSPSRGSPVVHLPRDVQAGATR